MRYYIDADVFALLAKTMASAVETITCEDGTKAVVAAEVARNAHVTLAAMESILAGNVRNTAELVIRSRK